jgi:fructose-1,6-bisphosphatase II
VDSVYKDEAPMLYIGERLGNAADPLVDVAVDPIEGTKLVAEGTPGSIAVVALATRNSLFVTPGMMYMD